MNRERHPTTGETESNSSVRGVSAGLSPINRCESFERRVARVSGRMVATEIRALVMTRTT